MRLVKSTETLEKNEKKLLYMCNARPVLKMRALFSDATKDYRNPPECDPGDSVALRLRTGKYNVLGGFYINYSITLPSISVAKLSRNILRFFVHFIQSVYSTLCTTSFSLFSSSKRASNSSLEIFSFSRRSDALLSRISLFSEIIVFARE